MVRQLANAKEEAELGRGGVMKGILEPGEGDASPSLGDLVFLHYTILDARDKIFESTLAECGGPGHPRPFILGKQGKGARPLRGVEIALSQMLLHERCALQLKPEFAFSHKECTLQPPLGLRKEDALKVDVKLVGFYSEPSTRSMGLEGVVIRTIKEGSGWETPRAPFLVTLEITARSMAEDGEFQQGCRYFPPRDDSSNVWAQIECSLGDGSLPPGLDSAVSELHKGEEAIVYCPVSLATGGRSLPDPPPLASSSAIFAEAGGEFYPSLRYVEFTVTLVDFLQVRDLTGDGGAMKQTLRKGHGEFPADCPLEDTAIEAKVRVRQAGRESNTWLPLAGSLDSEGLIRVETGMGAVPHAVEAALRLMLRGELSLVKSNWTHSYENRTDTLDMAEIPPGSDVEFKIELIDFEPPQNLAEASADAKLTEAKKWREQGNTLFKAANYKLARAKYIKGIRSVDQAMQAVETDEQIEVAKAAKVACLVNLAACAQKDEELGEVIKWCDKALEEDELHPKAHFRRAVARYQLGQEEAAMEDFAAVKRLDPSAAGDVDREVTRLAARARAAAAKQRKEWGSFFGGKKK